jgi:hypothetical protein
MKTSLFIRCIFLIAILTSSITTNAQQANSITDIRDQQIYNVVHIGNQLWMKENLNTIKFLNGDPLSTQEFCYYLKSAA